MTCVKSFHQAFQSSYPHLLEVGGEVLSLCDHRDVVVLSLPLGQQLEPAPGALSLPELRDTETGKMLREIRHDKKAKCF